MFTPEFVTKLDRLITAATAYFEARLKHYGEATPDSSPVSSPAATTKGAAEEPPKTNECPPPAANNYDNWGREQLRNSVVARNAGRKAAGMKEFALKAQTRTPTLKKWLQQDDNERPQPTANTPAGNTTPAATGGGAATGAPPIDPATGLQSNAFTSGAAGGETAQPAQSAPINPLTGKPDPSLAQPAAGSSAAVPVPTADEVMAAAQGLMYAKGGSTEGMKAINVILADLKAPSVPDLPLEQRAEFIQRANAVMNPQG